MDLARGIAILIALIALLFVLRLVAWCLADALRDTTLTHYERSMWIAFLLVLSVVAAPVYVTVGPGRDRWNSSSFWRW